MSANREIRTNCPYYWPKLKPHFPCDDCPYPHAECFDLCERFQERREALGAELGSCTTCEFGTTDCVWLDPPAELRALLAENAPHWQIRRWLKDWYRGR